MGVKRYLKRCFITNLFQAPRQWFSRTVKSDAKYAGGRWGGGGHSPLQIGRVLFSLGLFYFLGGSTFWEPGTGYFITRDTARDQQRASKIC